MSEFSIQSASIDVERIMEQIRAQLTEKRNADYTEEQIRELANLKLDRFSDPGTIRSDLVASYRKRLKERQASFQIAFETPPAFDFDPEIVYRSNPGFTGRVLTLIRKLARPFVKLIFNPRPILHALTIQQEVNERYAEVFRQMVKTQSDFIEVAALNYEVMHNLVMEMTRLSIEMKNHRMRVESIAGRLDFSERRARALETVVEYREGTMAPPASPNATAAPASSEGSIEPKRRRRRRGRRRPGGQQAAANAAGEPGSTNTAAEPTGSSQPARERAADGAGEQAAPAGSRAPADSGSGGSGSGEGSSGQ